MASSSTKTITGSSTVNDSEGYVKQTWTETTAAGVNTYAIQDTTESVKLTLKGSGDVVRIEGNSGDYTIKLSGKSVTLVGHNQKIVIAMQTKASAVLSFTDGSATVNLDTKHVGNQKLTTKLKQIAANVNSDSTETAATLDYFDDSSYTVKATTSAVTEGQDALVTLTLDKPAKSNVVLNYYTQSGTASSNDFINGNNSVTIFKGQSSVTIPVSTLDDSSVESAETLTLRVTGEKLTAPVDQVVTINDNDVEPVPEVYDVTLDAEAFVDEGEDVVLTISLDRPAESDVVLTYNTLPGTANSKDFVSTDKTVTIFKGQDSVKVVVPTTDDKVVEDTEDFTIVVNGSKLSSSAEQTITIADDDIPSTSLTAGQDNLTGTSGDNLFTGVIVNNSNTFQSGDVIDGGAGKDTLQVRLGSSSDFAITAETKNVEKFVATVQSTDATGSSGTNNVDTTGQKVTVDAEQMFGVKEYWNSDSRADLKVEDIRILDNEITKDITIGLRNTDPGSINPANVLTGVADNKVDYEVYFSPESLRPENATSSSIVSLSVHSTLRSVVANAAGFDPLNPLKGFDFTKFSFLLDDKTTTIDLNTAIKALSAPLTTYAQLQSVLRSALDAAGLKDVVLKTTTESFVSEDAQTRFADLYTLSWAGHKLAKIVNGTGWESTGIQASDNALSAYVYAGTPDTNAPLITSTIILDNVGREDEAGTLTIGSMSTHGGVERFEITVENNGDNAYTGTQSGSWLGHMQSTSNTLEEVTVVNAAAGIANPDYLYLGTNRDQAGNNLTVMQDWPGSLDRFYNAIAPANATNSAISQSNGFNTTPVQNDIQQKVSSLLNANGLTDVRLFDASAMKGNVYVGASITADTIRKYQNLVDALSNDKADDIAFVYKTGSSDDSINLQIDGTVAASHSRNVTGRHDFSFLVDGGTGNDTIRVGLVNGLNGNVENWYNNQDINNNVTINGGDGNDTIFKPGAGDTTINAGTGNDTVYTDNTGKQTIVTRNADGSNGPTTTTNDVYVFNAVDSNGGTVADGGYNVFDLRSQVMASVSAVNAQVTVNYLGIAKTVYIANSNNASANVAITDLAVNQAIKDAINNDAVLNKLLVAQDGPGRTLVVSSLIDGQAVDTSALAVTFGSTPLTPAQVGITGITLFGATNTGYAALTDGYVTTIFGQDNTGVSLTGANSTATSDNVILPGTGNDVVVLGTTVGATFAASSNETVVYEPAFGNDTVVEFSQAGTDIDHFDFIKLGGSTLTGTLTTDKSITVANATADATIIGNLFSANNAAAQTHVYVAVNAHNIGSVYTITDPAGASNAVATLQGTIDLADTAWGSLTQANFVDSSVANYSLVEGPNTLNGSVPPVVVPPVVVPPVVVPGTATTLVAGGSVAATTAADAFKLAPATTGAYTTTVSGFDYLVDKIQVPAGATLPSAVAGGVNNVIDGNVNLTWANSGNEVTISLTGLNAATETAMQLNAVSATVFGTY